MITRVISACNFLKKSLTPTFQKRDMTTKGILLKFDKEDLLKINNLIKHIPCNYRMEINDDICIFLYELNDKIISLCR